MRKIIIEEVENGYILRDKYLDREIDEKKIYEYQSFIVEEGIENLLYKIADLLGEGYDKFSRENIRISFDKKGHKVE